MQTSLKSQFEVVIHPFFVHRHSFFTEQKEIYVLFTTCTSLSHSRCEIMRSRWASASGTKPRTPKDPCMLLSDRGARGTFCSNIGSLTPVVTQHS